VALKEATLELNNVFAEGKVLLLDSFVIANQGFILFDLFLQRGNVGLLSLAECALWQRLC